MNASPLVRLTLLGIAVFASRKPALAETVYSYTTFDAPGIIAGTYPQGINNNGQIVGEIIGDFPGRAFVYSGGVFTTIDPPGGPFAFGAIAYGINSAGQIVGSGHNAPRLAGSDSFLDSNGSFSNIDVPGALGTQVQDINDSAQIIGYFLDSTGVHGYLQTGGTFTTIDVPGVASGTIPIAISNRGQIVGTVFGQGFVYDGGAFTLLDIPGAIGGSGPAGINSSGQITGQLETASGGHGFVYSGGSVTLIDVPGAVREGTTPTGINDSGQVVGWFVDAAGTPHGFLATPEAAVPEPRTWPVLAGWLIIGLVALPRRSKRT